MWAAHPAVSVGCDLVALSEIEESERLFGDRYLRRIFTDSEIAYCTGPHRTERLAARFAAKEAVIKALRLTDVATPLREIEIGHTNGVPIVQLHGSMAVLAGERKVGEISISLSHTDCHAMALAAASSVAPHH